MTTSSPKPCPFCGGPAAELGLKVLPEEYTCSDEACPGSFISEPAERWNRRPNSAGDVREAITNHASCYICGAPAFCSVNIAPGAASGGTMKPVCDEHNPYASALLPRRIGGGGE